MWWQQERLLQGKERNVAKNALWSLCMFCQLHYEANMKSSIHNNCKRSTTSSQRAKIHICTERNEIRRR